MVDIERIKKAREAAGLTQRALANHIHLTQGYIGDIERGRTNPSISTLQLIADALNVDIAEFIGNGVEIQETGLTNDEIHLISVYRSLNDEDKSLMKLMAQRFNKKNVQSTKLPITGMMKKNNRVGLASGRA